MTALGTLEHSSGLKLFTLIKLYFLTEFSLCEKLCCPQVVQFVLLSYFDLKKRFKPHDGVLANLEAQSLWLILPQ